MVEFTKDELFFIEQEFDVMGMSLHNKITKLCENLLFMSNIIQNEEDKNKVLELLMKELRELHRTRDIVADIRLKLEEWRKKNG